LIFIGEDVGDILLNRAPFVFRKGHDSDVGAILLPEGEKLFNPVSETCLVFGTMQAVNLDHVATGSFELSVSDGFRLCRFSLFCSGELNIVKFSVRTIQSEQFLVAAGLHDPAPFQDDDPVCVLDG